MSGVDLSTETIKELFNQRIREMTRKAVQQRSFDLQFSGSLAPEHKV